MNLSLSDSIVLATAVTAILMAGSTQIRLNLFYYSMATLLIGMATQLAAYTYSEPQLYLVGAAIILVKALAIPLFLNWTINRISIKSDVSAYIPAPLAMHLSILLFGASYLVSCSLPSAHGFTSWAGATGATSLLFTGLIMMLTRRIAVSQIIGFLIMENGIYLFALTQTRGMPLIIEMGILLDVLVGVMMAGLLTFRIKESFEHIDVSQLTDLRD